jgi:hypothetical protein
MSATLFDIFSTLFFSILGLLATVFNSIVLAFVKRNKDGEMRCYC